MNTGLGIWSKKTKKRKSSPMVKKPEEDGVVCFINFRDVIHHKVNGKFVKPFIIERQGLQVEHFFYYLEQGKMERSAIRKHGAKVLKKFKDIPEWADSVLVEKYNSVRAEFLNKGILKEVAGSLIPIADTDGSGTN